MTCPTNQPNLCIVSTMFRPISFGGRSTEGFGPASIVSWLWLLALRFCIDVAWRLLSVGIAYSCNGIEAGGGGLMPDQYCNYPWLIEVHNAHWWVPG